MATWEDGPEYAPLEPPSEYHASDIIVMEEAVSPAPKLAAAPLERPAFFPTKEPVPPLEELGNVVVVTRDPTTAFEVSTAAMTVSGGRGDLDWSPEKPLGTSGPIMAYIPPWQKVASSATINPQSYPQYGTPAWFGPAATPIAEPVKLTETVKKVFSALTLPVLICLLLGGAIKLLAPLMLLLSFLLSTRIPYRQNAIRQLYTTAGIILGLVAVTSVMNSSDMEMLFEMLSNFSQPLCWIMGAILTVMIYTAISKNENLKASRMLQSNQKVSINTATVQQLEVVPGIGPVIAQRIVAFRAAHRGFSSLEQLIEVDGIGHRNFPAISKYLQL